MPKINITKHLGFTLIELLVVISIIGLLSTMAVFALNVARMKARDVKRKADLVQIQKALELYYDRYSTYPGESCSDLSIGSDNCGCGICGTAPGSCGNDWCYSNYIGKAIRDSGIMNNLPKDPLNNSVYYYYYEPDCNQGGCPSPAGCCYYVIGARLEGGGSVTRTGGKY